MPERFPSRRQVLRGAAALAPSLAWPCLAAGRARRAEGATTFFVTADPQISVSKWGTAGTERTIDDMNALPGRPFPLGGVVGRPAGVLVAGDLVDRADDEESWARYRSLFDPRGKARLELPAFELAGNHDVSAGGEPGALGAIQQELVRRNRSRPGVLELDAQGYHYAWTWAGVRFIALHLFPGIRARAVYGRPAPWNDPHGSLAFLRQDLAERVADRAQPIVLMWHYGLRGWGREQWWSEEDLDALAAALEGFNVALILHGHEHRFERYTWRGHDVVMAPSPQHDRDPEQPASESRPKGFLVFRLGAGRIEMAHRTPQGWAETWSEALGPAGSQTH